MKAVCFSLFIMTGNSFCMIKSGAIAGGTAGAVIGGCIMAPAGGVLGLMVGAMSYDDPQQKSVLPLTFPFIGTGIGFGAGALMGGAIGATYGATTGVVGTLAAHGVKAIGQSISQNGIKGAGVAIVAGLTIAAGYLILANSKSNRPSQQN